MMDRTKSQNHSGSHRIMQCIHILLGGYLHICQDTRNKQKIERFLRGFFQELRELLHGVQDLWQLSLAALWWSRSYEKWGERERRSRVFRLSGSPVAGILGMAGIGACSGGGGLLHGRSAPTANR